MYISKPKCILKSKGGIFLKKLSTAEKCEQIKKLNKLPLVKHILALPMICQIFSVFELQPLEMPE